MPNIREEDVIAFKNSGQFDEEWYCSAYPDVAQSGLDPAFHFLWLGVKLGRSPLRPWQAQEGGARQLPQDGLKPSSAAKSEIGQLDFLFVDGTNGTSSTPYRVSRIAEGLATEGFKVLCTNGEGLVSLIERYLHARVVVIHRAPYWSPFVEFTNKMRALGSIIVFDVDDLIFDETLIPQIDGYRYLTEDQKDGFLRGLRAYREFILHADMCTAPTNYLVDAIRALGKPASRVRNSISHENIKFFDEIGYRRQRRPSPFVVGYYSGTKTHQADFSTVAPALIRFMQTNPDVVFRIVGEFDLSEHPELVHWSLIHRAGDIPRVTRVGLMAHDAMVRDQLSCDLIIAPLEAGNPFCEAKSELKFFEASLARCPVIATPTRTFSEATENGIFGTLATTTEEWLYAFNEIYNRYGVALQRAERASNYVRNAYSQSAATLEALEAYDQFSKVRRGQTLLRDDGNLPVPGTADVGVILPDFTGPSGGHRKIFTICKAIEDAGFSVKLYFYSGRRPTTIKRDIERIFCKLEAQVSHFIGAVDNHHTLICTQWRSAYDCRNINFSGKVLYFVQDFEPLFYPAGSDYIKALVSYNDNFDLICYGRWVSAKLKDELGYDSKVIPFTLDHETYHRPPSEGLRDIDVLLFARPSQDRRCFELIAEGLADLKRRRPEVVIGLFGEDDYGSLNFEFTNYGSITQLPALAALYHRSKVGICYSPTNPSQLGYEMIACGVGLIDVRVKFSELNFDGENVVCYCDGTPEDMRRACEELLDNGSALAERRKRGYDLIGRMPEDEQLGRAFIAAAGLGRTLASAA